MKNQLLVLLLVATIWSCDKEDAISEVSTVNSIEMKVDNTSYQLTNENVSANENCDGVFVSSAYRLNGITKFYLTFSLLKNGALKEVRYDEYENNQSGLPAKNFFTPKYNPVSRMTIKNFVYNANENYLYFEFDGIVYEDRLASNSRAVSGKVEIKNLKKTNCSVRNTKIEYSNNTFNFNSIAFINTRYSPSNDQVHTFLSNNGFKINLKSSDDFWDLPISTINFDETSSNNTVEIEEYTGPLVAGQAIIEKPEDWKIYQTRGSYTIEQKIIENGFKTIKGKINLEVLYNGNLIYTLNNINYSTGSFEN